MDKHIEDYLDEIISQLARVGRPDLIQVLRQHFNYTTESETESEEMTDGEEETIIVDQDAEGFLSLK